MEGNRRGEDATGAALRIANKLSSWGRENAEEGNDFEDVILEQAEEIMLMESVGINPALTVQDSVSAPSMEEESGNQDEEDGIVENTSEANGAKTHLANGRGVSLEV